MRQKFGNRITVFLVIFILGLIVYGNGNKVYASTGLETYLDDNRNTQNYANCCYAECVLNYLVKTENGYMRVHMRVHMNTSNLVFVEYFDENYNFVSQKVIDFELPIAGGFFAGTDYYYLVFGNENESESDSVEVVRVVKYDKNWNRIAAASIYGANTSVPFEAGSLRMAETNGLLYVRTCHEMYKAPDGYNHQANMTIIINESDMTIADQESDITDYSQKNQYFMSYVSHSFNQFVMADRYGDIVFLDHGDGYPRAALIAKEGREKWSSGQKQEIVSYEGDWGDNWTYASIGGLEYAGNNYLTVGTKWENRWDDNFEDDFNYVYVSVNDRDLAEETRIIRLIEKKGVYLYTPQLVKIADDKLMVLWSEYIHDEEKGRYYVGKLHYVYVDENGNMLGSIKQVKGSMSDCQPIAVNGKVVWTTSDNKNLKFNVIDESGVYSNRNASYPEDMIKYPIKMSDCRLVSKRIGIISPYILYNDFFKLFQLYTKNSEEPLQLDADYGFRYYKKKFQDNSAIEAVANGEEFYGKKVFYSDFEGSLPVYIHEKPQNVSARRISSGIRIKWKEEPYALGYYVYRKCGDGSYEKIATITDVSENSYVDPVARKNKPYSYYIKTYTTNGKKLITTKRSKVLKIN